MGLIRRKGLIAGCITAALGFWLLARLTWEPTYHGRSLNTWLAAYDARDSTGAPIPEPEADAALRAMGSRAIPGLLRRLTASSAFGLPKLVKQSSVPKAAPIPSTSVTVGGKTYSLGAPYGYTPVGAGSVSNKTNLFLSTPSLTPTLAPNSIAVLSNATIIFRTASTAAPAVLPAIGIPARPLASSTPQTAVPAYAQSAVAQFIRNHTPFFIERRWTPPNRQWWNVYAAFQALGPLGGNRPYRNWPGSPAT